MNWINCNDVILDLSKVDYIEFEFNEEEVPQVCVYFSNRSDPVIMEGEDMNDLISYFQSVTINRDK